jgi:hypothetical protein
MHHVNLSAAETLNGGAIRAVLSDEAAHAMARSSAIEASLVVALDKTYGPKGWFMFWDEDLAGQPIRGTVTLSFAGETLVIG